MTTKNLQIPLPLSQSWPVRLRLRFKLDAMIRPRYSYLRSTPVQVLSPLTFMTIPGQWRQYLAVFAARYPEERFGWALML